VIWKYYVDRNIALVNSKKSRNRTLLFIKNQRRDHQILTLSTNGMKKIGGGVTIYDSAITEENQANLKNKTPTISSEGLLFWWAHQDLNLGPKDSGLC